MAAVLTDFLSAKLVQLDAALGYSPTVTSGARTFADQQRLLAEGYSPSPTSHHLISNGATAVDLVPPPGETIAQLGQDVRNSGMSFSEFLNEGDHIHVAFAGDGGTDLTAAAAQGAAAGLSGAMGPAGQLAAAGAQVAANGVGSLWGNIEDFFVRFGLIILGAVIIVVALWMLLSEQGVVPSPSEVGQTAIKAAALAA